MELLIDNSGVEIREVTFSKLIVRHPSINRDRRIVTRMPDVEILALGQDNWRPYALSATYPRPRYKKLITPLG